MVKNLPKTEEKTGSNITLEDTIEGYFYHDDNEQGMQIRGQISQHTTDGRNKFNNDDTPIVIGNNTVQKIDTGIRVTATASDGNQFVIYKLMDLSDYIGKVARMKADFVASSENLGSIKFGVCSADGSTRQSKTSTSVSGTTIYFTVPSELGDNKYLAVWLYSNNSGTAVAGDYVDYTKIIVTIDNEDMTYEEYTGGISSPNPNYEQKIKYVTGNNTVRVRGNNLLNFNVTQDSKVTVNTDRTITINGRGGFSLNFESLALKGNTSYSLKYEVVSGSVTGSNIFLSFSGTWLTPTYPSATYTPTSDETKNAIWINNTASFDNCKLKIWVNEGNIALPFEPYITPITKQLSLGNLEIYEDGYFSYENNKWYLNNEYGKFQFDENTANISYYGASASNRDYAWQIKNTLFAKNLDADSIMNAYMDKFKEVSPNSFFQQAKYAIIKENYVFSITPSNQVLINAVGITTGNEFLEFLEEIKPLLVTKLATPSKTEITDPTLINQLNDIYKLLSIRGTTIVETECEVGNMPIVIKAKALLDMNSLISKMENIETRLALVESEE